MTYVTLHGTLGYMEKGYIEDGHISVVFASGLRDHSWNFEKSFKEYAESVLTDGNYFSEEDGGVCKKK